MNKHNSMINVNYHKTKITLIILLILRTNKNIINNNNMDNTNINAVY